MPRVLFFAIVKKGFNKEEYLIRLLTVSLLLAISCTAAYAIDYKNKPEPWQKVRNAFIISRSLSCLYAHKNDSDEVRRACTKRILDDFDICEKKAGDDHNALQECLDSLGKQQ